MLLEEPVEVFADLGDTGRFGALGARCAGVEDERRDAELLAPAELVGEPGDALFPDRLGRRAEVDEVSGVSEQWDVRVAGRIAKPLSFLVGPGTLIPAVVVLREQLD